MMEVEAVSEALDCSSVLKRLIALEDFIAFSRREGGIMLLRVGKNAFAA
jgi:hypothetical protein